MEYVTLGKITAPAGIKGEVRVYPYTDELTRFAQISHVVTGQVSRAIQSVRYQKGMVVLKLAGVEDRNAAEGLRGQELLLPKDEMWEQPEGTYFIRDLIGMAVQTAEGTLIGELSDVIQNPAQDIYEIKKVGGGSFLLPAVSAFILDVDTASRLMTVRLIEGMTE